MPVENVGHCRRGVGAPQCDSGKIIGHPGFGHPSLRARDPPRKYPTIRAQDPALPSRSINERKDRILRALKRIECAAPFEIAECSTITGKQEMVAVVDPATEFRIEIGSAAPAGMKARFVQTYFTTCGSKLDRGSKTGKTGANDMRCAWPDTHMRPCRSASQSLREVDRLTRAAGSRHSERSKAASVAW